MTASEQHAAKWSVITGALTPAPQAMEVRVRTRAADAERVAERIAASLGVEFTIEGVPIAIQIVAPSTSNTEREDA